MFLETYLSSRPQGSKLLQAGTTAAVQRLSMTMTHNSTPCPAAAVAGARRGVRIANRSRQPSIQATRNPPRANEPGGFFSLRCKFIHSGPQSIQFHGKIIKRGKTICHYASTTVAPDFTAETTQGTIHFHEWIGDNWAVLFSHPRTSRRSCTTDWRRPKA